MAARSRLFDDIHSFDSVDRLMRQHRGIDLAADASGTGRIVSEPASADISDHYRMSSPNRISRGDDSTMRSRRYRRTR